MGYFSNGTEGLMYEERYCVRCVHYQPDPDKPGCPIWGAHWLYAYEGNHAEVLDMLIPRAPAPEWNARCRMFVAPPQGGEAL